ncbi:hypothetical protein [Ralstonia sp. A12]|uniref:hypothetical protein n=1 Tax=Ralstonia sp. A12 TaxID=1217052 RepID=UPI0012EE4BA6|nr:hypothetical protein [Ralstonia sp. A12]
MPWNPVLARAMPAQWIQFLLFLAQPLSWAMAVPIFQSCLLNLDSPLVHGLHHPCLPRHQAICSGIQVLRTRSANAPLGLQRKPEYKKNGGNLFRKERPPIDDLSLRAAF